MTAWHFPPPLQPGDKIYVLAPSGTLRDSERARFESGLAVARSRSFSVHLDPNYDASEGYLAGSDALRRQALAQAWENPEYKAIFCVRGGYGSMRLLEDWHWTTPNPKWVVGFSDITAILWSLAVAGISSLHAPVLTTLGQEPEWSVNRLFDYLEGKPLADLQGEGWGTRKAQGWLLPGNLTVATHLLGTRLQPNLEGAILAFEDVTEAPYRIDRLLTQWRLAEAFRGVRGIALGRFSRCVAPAGIPSWTIEEVWRDAFSGLRACHLNLPIVANLPFGHDGVNAVLPVGQSVELDSTLGTLKFISK
jgi:muramoyltetrapeptide carboxypeptidase